MQNEVINSQYELISAPARTYCKRMKLPTTLVLRLHSKEVEPKAVAVMSHPGYNPNQEAKSFNFDPSMKSQENC